jgi:hypothetical protein
MCTEYVEGLRCDQRTRRDDTYCRTCSYILYSRPVGPSATRPSHQRTLRRFICSTTFCGMQGSMPSSEKKRSTTGIWQSTCEMQGMWIGLLCDTGHVPNSGNDGATRRLAKGFTKNAYGSRDIFDWASGEICLYRNDRHAAYFGCLIHRLSPSDEPG